jgi:pyruvate/2-oxoglutarate dehydrogenase complex dihydrolipoamide acyltransferase (E2) component
MTPLRFARARMVPVLLLLIGSPAWLPAQQKDAVPTRTVKVIYPGPNSFNENGYEGGSTVDVRYTFNACAGTVVIALGLRPKTLIPAAGYWYNGRLYPLAGELATIAPPVIPSVQISGNVYHAGAAAAIISASASDSDKAGCLAESLTNVISISRYLPRTPTREMIDQLLSSFTLPTQMTAPGPLRNRAIEEAIEKRLRSEAEQAEAERKKAEEDAHAVAEAQRKKAEAEEKQTEEDQEKWEEQLNRKRAERERAAEEVVAAEQANWEQQLAISREKRAQEVRQQEDLRRQQEQEAKDAVEAARLREEERRKEQDLTDPVVWVGCVFNTAGANGSQIYLFIMEPFPAKKSLASRAWYEVFEESGGITRVLPGYKYVHIFNHPEWRDRCEIKATREELSDYTTRIVRRLQGSPHHVVRFTPPAHLTGIQ